MLAPGLSRKVLMALFIIGLHFIRPTQGQLPPTLGPGFPPIGSFRPPLLTTAPPESTDAMLQRWMDKSLLHSNLYRTLRKPLTQLPRYSCEGRCNQNSRTWDPNNSLNQLKCFCDERCVALNDCCYDYASKCGVQETDPKPYEVCAFKRSDSRPYGFIFARTCPTETEPALSQRCTNVNNNDIMTSLPVFDVTSRKAYRNIFCAACGNARNISIWRVRAYCPNATLEYNNLPQIANFIKTDCKVRFWSPRLLTDLHSICIPQLNSPFFAPLNNTNTTATLKALCEAYAFPVCTTTPDGLYYWFKNPHCILYHGVLDLRHVTMNCYAHNPPLPPLTILFDFRSTTSYVISEKRGRTGVAQMESQTRECKENQAFDPFIGRCRDVLAGSVVEPTGSHVNGSQVNCTYVALSKTEYQLYENGTLFVEVHHRYYNNGTYRIINGTVYVCNNFTRQYKVDASSGTKAPRYNMHALSFLSVAGCGLSVVSLLILIFSYSFLTEMRNIPGQIVLSLASTMLAYHLLYFLVNQSDKRALCVGIAVSLHYTLLSAFCWMNVMAFDVHQTFTRRQGPKNRTGASRGCLTGTYLRYAAYSWGAPLVVVIVSLCLEFTRTWNIEYGSGQYCFIGNPDAILYMFAAPVAALVLYNLVALSHTIWHIRLVRKQTSKVANQRRQLNLTTICLKMTSGMGITWILGYIASTQATSFVWYAYVILNSLQGFLIMVSYVLNKRVLSMYRESFKRMRTSNSTRSNKSTNNTTPGPGHTLPGGSSTTGGPISTNYRKMTATSSCEDMKMASSNDIISMHGDMQMTSSVPTQHASYTSHL